MPAAKSASRSSSKSLALTREDLNNSTASGGVLALGGFVPAGQFVKPEGAITKTMSPMVKPKDFPAGAVYTGVFARIFKTNPGLGDDGQQKEGEGVEIIPAGADIGISLPCVATLKTALGIQGKGESATSEYLGRTVAIQKMEQRIPSKKGQAAWHFIVSIFPADYKAPGTSKK